MASLLLWVGVLMVDWARFPIRANFSRGFGPFEPFWGLLFPLAGGLCLLLIFAVLARLRTGEEEIDGVMIRLNSDHMCFQVRPALTSPQVSYTPLGVRLLQSFLASAFPALLLQPALTILPACLYLDLLPGDSSLTGLMAANWTGMAVVLIGAAVGFPLVSYWGLRVWPYSSPTSLLSLLLLYSHPHQKAYFPVVISSLLGLHTLLSTVTQLLLRTLAIPLPPVTNGLIVGGGSLILLGVGLLTALNTHLISTAAFRHAQQQFGYQQV